MHSVGKPGVDPEVLRWAARACGLVIMVLAHVFRWHLGDGLYSLVYGFGAATMGNSFTNQALGQVDEVKLQQLHDSMQPPAPPSDETLQ
jgi:hypothetical protein